MQGETNFTILSHTEFKRSRRLNSKRRLKLAIARRPTRSRKELTLKSLRKHINSRKWVQRGGLRKYLRRLPSGIFVMHPPPPTGNFERLAAQYSSPYEAGAAPWTSTFIARLEKRRDRLSEDRAVPPGLWLSAEPSFLLQHAWGPLNPTKLLTSGEHPPFTEKRQEPPGKSKEWTSKPPLVLNSEVTTRVRSHPLTSAKKRKPDTEYGR